MGAGWLDDTKEESGRCETESETWGLSSGKGGDYLLGRQTVSRHIREAAPGEVSVGGVVFLGRGTDVTGQVGVYSGCLVGGLSEVVAKSAGTGNPGNFWADGLGASNSGDVGTCTGELWCELWRFLAVV